MIAMQYRFRLPTDYDIGIITARVRENGRRLDGFPGLLFKAWCYADVNDPHTGSEPLYAPFYLWRDSAAMAEFLQSGSFKKLVADFGRPQIDCWPVLEYRAGSALRQSAFARREITDIAPDADLARLGDGAALPEEITRLIAWDVQRWQRLCFLLSPQPFEPLPGAERYRIGHLSLPAG